MSRAIESLLDFKKHGIRTFEKFGFYHVHLKDLLNYLQADETQASEIIRENFIITNSLNFSDDPKEGLYIEEKGLYILMFDLESPLPEMRVYKMKCYELLYEKMKLREFKDNEN